VWPGLAPVAQIVDDVKLSSVLGGSWLQAGHSLSAEPIPKKLESQRESVMLILSQLGLRSRHRCHEADLYIGCRRYSSRQQHSKQCWG
jgi:hypothetical protein